MTSQIPLRATQHHFIVPINTWTFPCESWQVFPKVLTYHHAQPHLAKCAISVETAGTFQTDFMLKAKSTSVTNVPTLVFWDWQYLAISHAKYKVPYLFSPCMTKYCSHNALWKMSHNCHNYCCQHPCYILELQTSHIKSPRGKGTVHLYFVN